MSTVRQSTQPITADDATIEAALKDAFLPALLPALAHATGDLSILRDDLRPAGAAPGIEQGGMTVPQQEAARAIALETLRAVRDGRLAFTHDDAPDAQISAITAWMTSSPAAEEYLPLVLEELAPEGQDPRAPDWRFDGRTPFMVAVIGAGMSGILAGVRLKQAGVPFVIIEKNADVGGTWWENTYPGARVDVPNAFYSYSFAQKIDWPKHFSPQEVLLDYFRGCVEDYGLRDHIRFETEVLTMDFDDERGAWTLRLRTRSGQEETLEAQAVISAVGQLNRPNMPDIAGMNVFEGPSFHSAQWDHEVDLKDKRVAVIGTGASAAQFIPIIAEEAAELHIFQRTPNWFVPVPHYHENVPEGLLWLFAHVPQYMHWYRFWMFWTTTDGLLPAAMVDDAWPNHDVSISEANDQLRMLLTGFLHGQFADRPDLLPKILPQYPPASKRIILDNGAWASTLKRENVHLHTERIREITPRGVATEDAEYAADVIIYGTGFRASHFLTPMQVRGRGGIDLNEQWQGDARAYLGITVPNFPNFFMLYGPNTNIVVNGSIIYFSECEVRYVMGCLRLMLEEGHRSMDPRKDVHDAYNVRIDEANLKRAWGMSKVPSWYKNAKGRSAQNWPFNIIEYWRQTREPDPADYIFG